MNVLTTENLSKSYKEIKVVDNVNMHIEQGDIYGFVGENGAGKTTVIRLITGLAEPTEGTFSLFGTDRKSPNIESAKRRMCGIVEAVSLNRGMTALENLRLQSKITGVSKTDDELRELISLVGLNPSEVANKKTGNFSLGMRQRIGIAMTLISQPDLIILDEPMNGLDPTGFVEVRETILSLNRKGITFLISSHILSELDKVCTKIGVISGGKLLREMSMEDLHDNTGRRTVIQCASESDATKYAKILHSTIGNDAVKAEGNAVLILGENDFNEIVCTAVQNNIPLVKINVSENTIEDLYMNIVKGGAQK